MDTTGDGAFSNPQLLNPIYFPGTADKLNGEVNVCLKANGQNGCNSLTDCLTIFIHLNPVVDAGEDMAICENDFALLAGSGSNYTAILWTTTGDGTFNNPEMLNTIYNPGTNDLQAGNTSLCLNLEADAPCIDKSDCLIVNFYQNPELTLDSLLEVCIDEPVLLNAIAINYSSVFWSTSGDGTFDNQNLLQTIYHPGTQDITQQTVQLCLVLIGNGSCEAISSCTDILFIGLPTAFAGLDGTTLDNAGFELSAATAYNYSSVEWTSSGTGTFGNDTVVNTTYFPDYADGLLDGVVLKLTAIQDQPCDKSATDSLLLVVLPNGCHNVEIYAGADQTLCEDSTYLLSQSSCSYQNSLLWTTFGDGTYDDPSILHPHYTPGENDILNGSVMLQIEGFVSQPCSGNTDMVELFFQLNPVAYAGSDNTIPGNIGQYTFADAYAENTSMIIWSTANGVGVFDDDHATNPTYQIPPFDTLQGYVTFTLAVSSDLPCTISTDSQVTITFSDNCNNAVVDAGNNIALCDDDNVFAMSGMASNFAALQWTTAGDGTFDYPHTVSPKYILGTNDKLAGEVMLYLYAESFGECSSAFDSVTISPLVLPQVFAGGEQTICDGDICTTGQATASDYSSLEWTTTGDGTFDQPNDLVTNYTPGAQDIEDAYVELTLVALSASPCLVPVSNTLTIVINKLPQSVFELEDKEAIVGDDVTLYVVSRYAELFQWYGPNGKMQGEKSAVLYLENVNLVDSGFYYCKMTNDCGITFTNEAKIVVLEHQIITVPQGWSGFSSFINPANKLMNQIFGEYEDEFVLLKNMSGIYYPALNITTLSDWNTQSGYEINFTDALEFEMKGITNTNRTVEINEGWKYLPVISSCPVEIETLFNGHQSKINLIKEIGGMGIYWPAMGINSIGSLVSGRSYCMRSNESFEITYEPCTSSKSFNFTPVLRTANTTIWNDLHYSPSTHTIAIDPLLIETLKFGDVIGAFTSSGWCAGYLEISGNKNALVLFGDDPLTDGIDGFADNELIRLKIYRPSTGREFELPCEFDINFPHHDGLFVNNGISSLCKTSTASTGTMNMPAENISIYPNPTSGKISVYGLPAGSIVEVWNSEGQILRKINPNISAGDDLLLMDLSGCAAGVVYFRIYNDRQILIRKIVIK